MAKCLCVIVGLMACAVTSEVYAGKAGGNSDKCKPNSLCGQVDKNTGIQLNDDKWIIRVDRNRIFEELKICNPISTEKWRFAEGEAPDEEGNDRWLFPLEGARVRCLTICGTNVNEVLNNDKHTNEFETISLKGVQELHAIRFEGPIPDFKENTRWYGAKDSDWRRNLTTVIVDDDADHVGKIPFAGDVKCLEFGTGAMKQIAGWGSGSNDMLKAFTSLERLVIPYSVATNSNVAWGEIVRKTGLKGKEVLAFECSSETTDSREAENQEVVLLNLADSGEISDCVTTIREDAIDSKFTKTIFMPFKAKYWIGETNAHDNKTFALKKDSLLLYPDLLDGGQRRKLEESCSFFRECPVSATTAYGNLQLTVSTNNDRVVCGPMSLTTNRWTSCGSYCGTVRLLRDKDCKNELSAAVSLTMLPSTNVWRCPVCIVRPQSRKPAEKISVSFSRSALSIDEFRSEHRAWSVILFLCFLFGVGIVLCYAIWALPVKLIRRIKERKQEEKHLCFENKDICWLLAAVGLLIIVLGFPDIEVIQRITDEHLTGKTMAYLNSSFISSLVISVSTSLAQLAVGFLQSFSFSLFGLSVDLNSLLSPVQNIMDKVSTYSWISTGVLAFVRIMCQLLKDGAKLIWPALGVALVLYSGMRGNGMLTGRRWVTMVVAVASFLVLGLPLLLLGCSLLSSQLQAIAGDSFNRSMLGFAALAESFSVRSLTSVAGAQEMLAQFTNAISSLTSSAMYYIATKAFDCFMVPLVLYFGFKKAFSACSDRKDELLAQVKASIDKSNADLAAWFVKQGDVGAQKQADAELEQVGNATVAKRQIGQEGACGDGVPAKLSSQLRKNSTNAPIMRIKPEWITVGCAFAILVAVLLGGAGSAVVGGGGSTGGKPQDVVIKVIPPKPGLQGEDVVIKVLPPQTRDVYVGRKDDSMVGSVSDRKPSSFAEKPEKPKPPVFGVSFIGWAIMFMFVVVDAWVCWKAANVVRQIRNKDIDTDQKLMLLKEDDFYFDLPLYLGLFGTVLGFLLLSGQSDAQSGRVVAYFSTVFGILVSVAIHCGVAQYKSVCLGLKEEAEVLSAWGIRTCLALVRFMDFLFCPISSIKGCMKKSGSSK